jgi:hypothetical protein
MPDFRALCARMADELDHYRQLLMDDRRATHALAAEARAALAQPEPEGPTDEELKNLANKAWISVDVLKEYDLIENAFDCCGFARAVLARWGRPAIQPVPKQEDVHYAWELHDAEGEWQAGGSANSLDDVQREGNRYLQTYSQHGPHKLIIQQHRVTTIEPVPANQEYYKLLQPTTMTSGSVV